jgi:hypothetical protein
MDLKRLLSKSKKQIKDPDAIIDMYDQTFVWVKEKSARKFGYSSSEMVDERIFKFSYLEIRKSKELLTSFLSKNKIREIPLKTRDGEKVLKKVKYKILFLEKTPFLIVKFC